MKNKIKLFLPLVLIFSMLLGSTCFASGRGISPSLYGDNALNSQVIREFNNYSAEEQANVLKDLFPLMMQRLGFKMNDSYSPLNNIYQVKKAVKSNNGSLSANDYFNNSSDSIEEKHYYVYRDSEGNYNWYRDLSNYLINVISVNNDQLILTDTSYLYSLSNQYIEDTVAGAGIVKININSYKNINTSAFANLTQYNKFISTMGNYPDASYVVLRKNSSNVLMCAIINKPQILGFWIAQKNGYYYVNWVDANGNNNGNSLGGLSYFSVDTSGKVSTGSASLGTYTFIGGVSSLPKTTNTMNPNFSFNSSDNPSYSPVVYSCLDDKKDFELFGSYTAFINNQGHFEYPFTLTNYYNNVPNTVITSRDMSNIYNQIYTDNSVNGSNNTTTNVYYPGAYEPDSNSYDKDTHKLDFSGVGALLASIGDLIGSLINGFAQGFANIIESITSVARNIMEALAGGLIFEFLKSFMAWLPEPLPSLIFGLFTISVTFAVIRLVKGALS